MSVYSVKIRRDEEGYYVARCLELPAAMTQGKTEQEALRRIKEVITLIREQLKEERKKQEVRLIEIEA